MPCQKCLLLPLLLLVLTIFSHGLIGQNLPLNSVLRPQPTTVPPQIDGVLDEQSWKDAARAADFHQVFPSDNLAALSDTEVLITFDSSFLYLGAICYDTLPGPYVISSLKRDFDWGSNDNLSIYIDPFNDKTNGFSFGLSPYGVQREGLISNGEDVSTDWDNKWFSAVKRYHDRWTLEMAIPFKTLRYNPSNLQWNVNFLRNNQKQNERTSWIKVPQQYRASNLGFSGTVYWPWLPQHSGANVVLIPYLSSAVSKDHQAGRSTDYQFDAGVDAKFAVSPSLNLDLTINPDFSQAEVDQQVTNLDRFEIFFPEKRQFFLENSDLFEEPGFRSNRPFFSRRIGIAEDSTGTNFLVPIQYGARLSGKINREWRIGLLNMQTSADRSRELNAQNYTVATFQRQVFGRSNFGGILVNRQATDYRSSDSLSSQRYNRVFGFDYNLYTSDNRWEGSSFYHRSDAPGDEKENYTHGLFIRYASRNIRVFWLHELIGKNYQADVGFVRRTDLRRATVNVQGTLYPRDPKVVTHQPEVRLSYIADSDFNLTDREFSIEHEINFTNRSEVQFSLENTWIKLKDPFDPSGSDGTELPVGTEVQWWRGGIGYESDNRKLFNFAVNSSFGGFYNGNRFEVELESNYRYQPYGGIGLNFSYNHIELPQPFNDTDLFLIGPKIDLTFTDRLFLTTFVQYNNQQENLNINSRFQWRYAPVSDLFIVYTDNYLPESLQVKNRALVIKLSYWLNV